MDMIVFYAALFNGLFFRPTTGEDGQREEYG